MCIIQKWNQYYVTCHRNINNFYKSDWGTDYTYRDFESENFGEDWTIVNENKLCSF